MKGLRLLWELADSIRETDGLCGRECIAERIEGIAMVIESEDKLAADWVKSAGGLERVSAAWDWVSRHGGLEAVIDRWASSIPVGNARSTMHRAEERRRRLAAHAHHLEGLLSERRREIGRLRREAAEMRRRLIPEDMEWLVEEWPRFEDGAPLGRGDEMATSDGVVKADEFSLTICDEDGGVTSIDFGERVKRPAPKVLDADGVEICVGDAVYALCDGTKHVVEGIEGRNIKAEGMTYLVADKITHCAPVLAADGKPLREGEMVWFNDEGHKIGFVANGEPLKVLELRGKRMVGVLDQDDIAKGYAIPWWFAPSCFTHERPDSWERLEEDASKNPFDYCNDVGHRLDTCENSEAYKARDLVRRAKKLAGV